MNTEILSALFENGAYTLVVQKNGVTVHKDFGFIGLLLGVIHTIREII